MPKQPSKRRPSCLRAARAPQPSAGRSNPELTRATRTPQAYGYVWYVPTIKRAKRNPTDDLNAAWRQGAAI